MNLSIMNLSSMKQRLCYLAILSGTLLLQGCGGGGLAGSDGKDVDTMRPEAGVEDTSARPRPPENAVVITTDEHFIYDALKQPVFLRGVNHHFGDNPVTRMAGIPAIKLAGSNAIRLQIDENTTDVQLEGAMSKVAEAGMVAVLTFTASGTQLTCTEDSAYFLNAVDNLWLKKFMPILVQDRFQPHLMVNIANGWGAMDIFSSDSLGYQAYIDTYKSVIRKFRTAGFKFPLVIDAPSCGQDFNAFLNGRSRELMAADTAKNLVFGVHAEGAKWNTSDEIVNATALLYNEKVPFIVTSLTGPGPEEEGDAPIDHKDIMEKSVGNVALALNLPWSTATDSAAYAITLDSPLDLRGSAILSTNVFLDKLYAEYEPNSSGNYVPKGKLTFTLYAKDANGNTLKAGSTAAAELRSNQWSKLSFSLPKSADDIAPADLMNGSTTFDLTTVSKFGIQVTANGKAAELKAPIKFDDLSILPGAPAPTFAVESTFDTGKGPWNHPSWSPGKAVFADGYAKLSLGAGDWGLVLESPGWQSQEVLPKINFKQTVFVDMKIFVPASYAGKPPSFTVNGNFGSDSKIEPSTPANVVGELKFGEWNNYRAVLKWSEAYDVSIAQNIAIRLGGSSNAEPVLLDTITITQQAGQRTKTVSSTQYKATFAKGKEGFVNAGWDNGKATLEMLGGELLVTLPAGDKGAINKADISSISEIDFKGNVTIKMKLFVPEDWAGKEFAIKLFMQDGKWSHFEYASVKIADLVPGGWASLEFKPSFPASFSRTLKLNMFGFQFDNVPGGIIKFDDIEFIGDIQVPDAEPIFTLGFDNEEQYNSVKFDFAGGAFTESGLATAKYPDWKIVPFGWLASSWKGNTGDKAVLDISKAEDIVDLTERGEEVVNSTFGIKGTSMPASFAAPK